MANKPLFLGNNAMHLSSVNSTNTFLLELISKTDPPEGTIITADFQTQGKGQIGRTWVSEPGKNLLCSILLKPNFLSISDVFYLNIISSLAVMHTVQDLTGGTAQVKWPNDVLLQNKKISGILVHNILAGSQIKNSVIGIGLNINQDVFPIDQSISMSNIAGKELSIELVKSNLLVLLERYYLTLKKGNLAILKEIYEQHLYRKNERHSFHDLGKDSNMEGVITGITHQGKLIINTEDMDTFWALNEIKYL